MTFNYVQAKAQKKTNSVFVLACSRGYLDDVRSSSSIIHSMQPSMQPSFPGKHICSVATTLAANPYVKAILFTFKQNTS